MPVGVDPDPERDVYFDHPAALTNLHHQGVGGQGRVRAVVERAGADLLDHAVDLGGHDTDLRCRQQVATTAVRAR